MSHPSGSRRIRNTYGSSAAQKITFGEMREMGVRGVLVYCADYHCSHSVALSADRWPDESGSPTSSRGLSPRSAGNAAPFSGVALSRL